MTKHHAMKRGGIVPRILNLDPRFGKWLASRPGRLIPSERIPVTTGYDADIPKVADG
jgi:hypothetical protein